MARAPNFFYQDPTADIGSSLARAFLGDPEAAAKQRQMQAEASERAARTRLLNGQAAGQEGQNAASVSLPELLGRLRMEQPAAAPIPSLDDPTFIDNAGPTPPPIDQGAVFRDNLPAALAAMGQMNGDKVDPRQIIGTLSSFLGGDEMARRGMIAQGKTPDQDFAITPERADDIANRDAGAKLREALGVATINNESDIPVANIQAGARRDVATINNRDDIPVANIRAGAAGARSAGPAPGFDAIERVFPGVTMNSGQRSAERNRAVGGVDNSMHLGNTPGVQAYDINPQPGMTVEQAGDAIEAANPGVRVIERKAHRAKRPDGSLGGMHWHFALQNTGGSSARGGARRSGTLRGGAAPKPPKPVTGEALDTVTKALGTALEARGLSGISAVDKSNLLSAATSYFQKSGNPALAVNQTMEAFARNTARRRAARTRTPATPSRGNRAASAQPVRVNTPAEAQALRPGTRYLRPDGVEMIR